MKNIIIGLALATLCIGAIAQTEDTPVIISAELAQEQALIFQLRSDINAAKAEGKSDVEIAALITAAADQISDTVILEALYNTVTLAGASNSSAVSGITASLVNTALKNGASDSEVSAIIADAVAASPEAAADIQTALESTSISEALASTAIFTGLANADATAAGPLGTTGVTDTTTDGAPADVVTIPQNQPLSIPVSNTPSGISPN